MNKWIYIVFFLIVSCNHFSREKALQSIKNTSMEIEDNERHYFPIIRGAKLYSTFKFRNTGKEPLYIKQVIPSCGCVVSNYPLNSINPGGVGYISIEYDSKKNIGAVELYLDIYANLSNTFKKTITFDVKVVTNAQYANDYEQQYNLYLKENYKQIKEKGGNPQGYYLNSTKEGEIKF